MNPDQIALQLYTVRSLTQTDLLGTLRKLAEVGYRAVEFAGLQGNTVEDVRATLDECGIVAASAHIQLNDLVSRPEAVIAELQALGCKNAVVPWVAESYRKDVDTVRELAGLLTTGAKHLRDAGLRLGYHNHNFEFEPLGDTTMWELLVSETDPDLVDFQLDVFWAAVAGHDPVSLIQRHAPRLTSLHVKDRPAGGDRHDAPVGEGTLPWNEILAVAAPATRWYIVEQDHPQEPLDEVTRSLRNLEKLATH